MLALSTWHCCADTALRFARVCVAASLCIVGGPTVGRAEMDLTPNNPAIQALLTTPTMVKARAEAHKGNLRGAVVLLQDAARQGNQMANIFLGLAYFDGHGVKKDRNKAVGLIYKVIQKSENPTVFVAYKVIEQMSEVMKGSPDPKDRAMSMAVLIGALAANPYARQMSENMSHVREIPCFLC